MKLSVEVERPSPILRKLTIRVPAEEVKSRFDRGLAEVQKTAKIKGFRPGQVPVSMIKQQYGEDVRHQVLHHLIDESFEIAVRGENLKQIGSPKIDTPQHKTGEGAHDHTLHEDQDLTYVATFEVMPEIQVKDYTGIALKKEKVEINDEKVDKVVENLLNSQAQLTPIASNLTLADGTESFRPVQMGDFIDLKTTGGLVTETGVEAHPGMNFEKVAEMGVDQWIPGFEDQLLGMRRGETKTFRITFPADYGEKEMAGKEAEFTVTVNEIKEKKLPTLDDEFAKQMGYEGLLDLRGKAKDYLTKELTEESDRKIRSDLLGELIQNNVFEVPQALVESQTRALAQDWAQELKKQGYDEKAIQTVVTQNLGDLSRRAETQVRASLILESIAQKEGIFINAEDINQEITRVSSAMELNEPKLQEYYAKNPGRKEDLEFRLRQERTLKFLLDTAKIKSVEASDK